MITAPQPIGIFSADDQADAGTNDGTYEQSLYLSADDPRRSELLMGGGECTVT
jgi:hypothetical protein